MLQQYILEYLHLSVQYFNKRHKELERSEQHLWVLVEAKKKIPCSENDQLYQFNIFLQYIGDRELAGVTSTSQPPKRSQCLFNFTGL